MPELPEVETIVRDLKKHILGRKIEDVWSDFKKVVKIPADFELFKRKIIGKKIKKIRRRGKNILFDLSGKETLLIHQKLTGHLLYGVWSIKNKVWVPSVVGPLGDPVNRFIHLIFWLDNKKMLALSDLRKFAKVELWNKSELENAEEFKRLGPEPLEEDFTFNKFKKIIQKARGKIKEVLMNQNIIVGIGNIYSDEILWRAKIHPQKETSKLKEVEIKKIYLVMKKILKKAIKLGGESISDYRRISGEKGYFDKERRIYRREGEKCVFCGRIIKRIKIGGRSAHFCPKCQKI